MQNGEKSTGRSYKRKNFFTIAILRLSISHRCTESCGSTIERMDDDIFVRLMGIRKNVRDKSICYTLLHRFMATVVNPEVASAPFNL